MSRTKASPLRRVCTILGCGLVICALALLLFWQLTAAQSRRQTAQAADILQRCIPATQPGVWEDRIDVQMPVLSIDGADYLGLLELPEQAAVFPILAEAGSNHAPARRSGSIYDGSLVLTGSTERGQFDFWQTLSVGQPLCFTDLTGSCFSCRIIDIRHGTPAEVSDPELALVLILQSPSSYEPIFIYAGMQK